MPTRVSILSRSFTSLCTRKRANSTNLAGNYREQVEGKQCDPLHYMTGVQAEGNYLVIELK